MAEASTIVVCAECEATMVRDPAGGYSCPKCDAHPRCSEARCGWNPPRGCGLNAPGRCDNCGRATDELWDGCCDSCTFVVLDHPWVGIAEHPDDDECSACGYSKGEHRD